MCVQTIDSNLIKIVIPQQKNRFEVVDLGEASHLLGLTIKRDEETGTIEISQGTYARGVLETFGASDPRPTSTPAEVGPTSTRRRTPFDSPKYNNTSTQGLTQPCAT